MHSHFMRAAFISTAIHLTLIVTLLVSSMASCHRRIPRDVSPFTIVQLDGSAGKSGPAGGGREAAPPVKKDDATIPEPKPSKPKPDPNKKPDKPAAPPVKKLTEQDIKKILAAGLPPSVPVMGRGSGGSAAAGGAAGGAGGGTTYPFAWYLALIRNRLYEAWQQPSALAGRSGLIATATIRVERDGTISRKKMTQPAGNALMDASVMNAVNAMERVQELPPGFNGNYMDIDIEFELTETSL